MNRSTSVKKTQHQFQTILKQLKGKVQQLESRQETMETRGFVVVDEVTAPAEGGQSLTPGRTVLDEQPGLYHGEVGSLVTTATDILIKALQIKLNYINDVLERLSLLVKDNPRQATPTELLFSSYEDWLETNQQLFEFNSQLYELEKVKFEMKQKQERVKVGEEDGDNSASETITTSGRWIHSNSISQAQEVLSRLTHHSHPSHTTHAYIHEILNPRGGKMTLEAQKVQEYVNECFQYAQRDPNEVKGVHRERYQEFMGVLCSYIVEKQKNLQREDVPYELVYSAVEHCIIPQLKTLILPRVTQRERDLLLHRQCQTYSNVTQPQMKVRPTLQSNEPVPFFEAIAQLRASYFSSTPTDKMYCVVSAAKALYDRLGYITTETSIDGDAFLDLWVYVIIKANIKDLATNLSFMIDYGNPQLACGEAGYYLTTLEAAVQFISSLSPNLLMNPTGEMEFVVCEREHFSSLCAMPESGLELVNPEIELQGFRVAVLKESALNRARLFRCALVQASQQDSVKVAVIRVKKENANPPMTKFLLKELQCEELKDKGLYCRSLPIGSATFINIHAIGHEKVIILPSGDYDSHKSNLIHALTLERLGSLHIDSQASKTCAIYPSSVTRSQDLNIPVSPPYYSSIRGELCTLPRQQQAGGGLKRSEVKSISSLWSPYMFSEDGEEIDNQTLFTNEHAGMSVASEHRRLRQSSRVLSSIASPHHSNSGNSEITKSRSGNSEITRSHSGNSEITEAQLPPNSDLNQSPRDTVNSKSPRRITVEVEVHEDYLQTLEPSENQDGEEENVPQAHNHELLSDGPQIQTGPNQSSESQSAKSKNVSSHAPQEGSQADENSVRSEQINENSPAVDRPTGTMLLTREYRRRLEEAFVTNHLYGNHPTSVGEAARTIILQVQMYLQRLNYLSMSYKTTGEYDDITLNAVRTFQRAHNHHEAQFSIALPEDGYLSPTTYQFLRQAYMTIYASMVRIGLDCYLGEQFDPMSTAPRDTRTFRECVSLFQKREGLTECQSGVLCANTIHRMKQLLYTQKQVA